MSWLTEYDRAVLRALADTMIPEAEGMPSATSVGVADSQLDLIEKFRADLMPAVLRVIRASRGQDPAVALQALESSDPEAMNAVKLAVAAAYYLSPKVRAALDYNGVQRHPYDAGSLPERETLELLKPVISRGGVWRPTPVQR